MSRSPIFISHATKDDAFVKELRQKLEGLGLSVWVDSRNLRGGDKLAVEVEKAIENASQVIVVLSPNMVNSPWVRREIHKAEKVEKQRKSDGYRVIPLLLPGIEPSALALWFKKEPVAVPVRLDVGGLDEAFPAILAALGERLPDDLQPSVHVEQPPIEDLVLELRDAAIDESDGKRRVKATATLVYKPATKGAREIESKRFTFTAPLGPIEADDLRWYLEEYFRWPVGLFKKRAERVETQLPEWGQMLYAEALAKPAAQEALNAWKDAAGGAERRFSVCVDPEPPDGSDDKTRAAMAQAASALLSLPWELFHDGRTYLFQGKHPVGVRRRMPNRVEQEIALAKLPIRVLLVSPRPEDKHAGYYDHRASALPLVKAIENLGELVKLSVLTPPTFPALQEALRWASERGEAYDVVHFDGHGVFDKEHGLGALCFEDPKDVDKLEKRAMELIHAEKLAGVVRDYRIPLVFLEACQSAMTEENPTASVAGKLLEEGVTSVVAMSHTVLVETARRFVEAFYGELARGARVGKAMLVGQQALQGDSYRIDIMGAGKLHLQDWFVPVLYQEEQDPQLATKLPSEAVQQLQAQQRKLNLGRLPEPPPHSFIGRSRELLALERLLHDEPYAVVRGQGGAGKTALAIELARWLVRTGRFGRAAFAAMDKIHDARAVLDSLGQQLLPDGDTYSVAQFRDLEKARQPVERALRDHSTIIVLDNLESVLPDASGQAAPGAAPIEDLFALCRALLKADPATRIVFTSREPLPQPFNAARSHIGLGALSKNDAIELVSQVLKREGLEPAPADPGSTPKEIEDLVEAVRCHARALVLLAPELARRGVRATTTDLQQLMLDMDKRFPGDRERSLYASVELSLRRLPEEVREQVKILAVFHGGASLITLAPVFDMDEETARTLAIGLINVGLGEDTGYAHLRLDPALAPYLLGRMDSAEQEQLRARWADGMSQLAGFLYAQQIRDARLAAQLTLLELPNLLALLEWAQDNRSPEEIADLAGRIEQILAELGRPQSLARAVAARERAAKALGDWSNARFKSERMTIERLLDRGDRQSAVAATRCLLQRCLAVGEDAYPGADYDTAMAYNLMGEALGADGSAEPALEYYALAEERFRALGEAGARMAFVVLMRIGDCLAALGRLDEAAEAYEEAIKCAEKRNDRRSVAAIKGQLGTVRLLQRRYPEALNIYHETRDIFESLDELRTVATAWHQIGIVHRQAGQFELAERAYRESLAIRVRERYRPDEAASLNELGSLYDAMGRLEEAAAFYRQAADIYVERQDFAHEGVARSNLANTLIKLERYDEARRELRRAIECSKQYSHAVQPWRTWGHLCNLEQATGNLAAAAEARRQAVQCYLDYRRAGGENQNPGAELYAMVRQAIEQGDTTQVGQLLAQLSGVADTPPWVEALVSKLQAILNGVRDPALANDPALKYDDAVELQLLLESLG